MIRTSVGRPRQLLLGPWDSRAPVRRKAHGITPAEQRAMLVAQGGLCAICRRPGPLQIDHDHRIDPGRYGSRASVRGFLCGRCNSALGQIGDEHVDRLIAYLRR